MQDVKIIRAAYDAVACAYARLVPSAGTADGPEEECDLAMIRNFAASLPKGADVLDAGCGAGRMITYLDALAQQSHRPLAIQGCDLSGSMVALAKAAHPHRRILTGDLAALPYEPHSFHGLLAWYSIIHMAPEELPGIFTEFSRVLRPGGRLLLGFQAGTGQRKIINAYGQGVELTACLHPVPEVRSLLQRCGFRILASRDRGPGAAEGYRQGFVLAVR